MTYPAFHANYLARDLPANLCSRCGEPQPFTLRIPAGRYHFGTRVCDLCCEHMDIISEMRLPDLTPYFLDRERPHDCQPAAAEAFCEDPRPPTSTPTCAGITTGASATRPATPATA